MLLSIVLLGASGHVERDLVFAARYYYQGSRKSYQQIYLASHTGARRIQVTKNEFNSYAPMWIDRKHLAWVEAYKRVPSKDALEGSRDLCRVMIQDLNSGKRKKLGEIGDQYTFWGIWSDGNTFSLGGKENFRVTTNSVLKITKLQDETQEERFGEMDPNGDTLFGPGKGVVCHKANLWDLSWSIKTPNVVSDDDEAIAQSSVTMKSTWKGKVATFNLKGNHVVNAFIAANSTGLIQTSYAYEKYRHDNWLYRVSNDFRSCQLVSSKVGFLYADSKSELWHGMQPNVKEAAMARLSDGRSVYVNWIYAGNWRTGEQWTVAGGLVDAGNVQFRP